MSKAFGFQFSTASRGEEAVEVFTKNLLTGRECCMTLPVSQDRVNVYLLRIDDRLVQDQFPELDATQREFLISGYDEAAQIDLYGPNEDENLKADLSRYDRLVMEAAR